MEKERLKITSDNYIGYSELCKMKNFMDDKQTEELVKKVTLCLFAGFCISFPMVLVTQYFYSIIFCTGISALSVVPLYYHIKKKSINKVKRDYPYVNIDISNDELCDALQKVGIAKMRNGVLEKIDTRLYDNYVIRNEIEDVPVVSNNLVNNDINLQNIDETVKVKKKVMNIDKRRY